MLATPPASRDFALEALAKKDVLVHPGHFYDVAEDGCVVVSLLPQPDTFAQALGRLKILLE
jgi:aspartate/methionine/tyrosine aminotransferase